MRIPVALVIALHCAAAAAQLYSWKDADGKVHYSDEPPPNKTPARTLRAAPPPANPPAAKANGDKDGDAAKKAVPAAAKPEASKEDAELRRANCERARRNLQVLQSGAVRFTFNAQGERVALEGAVLEAELDNARKAIEGWCK